MTTIKEIRDMALESGNAPDPELVKVVIHVRTGGIILPPTWLKSPRQDRDAEPTEN